MDFDSAFESMEWRLKKIDRLRQQVKKDRQTISEEFQLLKDAIDSH
jgi:prefoldin subunit 5